MESITPTSSAKGGGVIIPQEEYLSIEDLNLLHLPTPTQGLSHQ